MGEAGGQDLGGIDGGCLDVLEWGEGIRMRFGGGCKRASWVR